MGQTKNRSSEKSHKNNKINMTATNFVFEQLTLISKNVFVKSLLIKHFYYNSASMRIIHDAIKEKQRNPNRHRESCKNFP